MKSFLLKNSLRIKPWFIRKTAEFTLCVAVFLIAALAAFFFSTFFCFVLFGNNKSVGFLLAVIGLVAFMLTLFKAFRLVLFIKNTPSFQACHLWMTVIWGFCVGLAVALFLTGNAIVMAGPL